MDKQWIGVELDGTLAEFNPKYPNDIGEPVGRMAALVKDWINNGQTVKVLSWRAKTEGGKQAVKQWLINNRMAGIDVLPTEADMATLWSARAVRVDFNTGKICQGCNDAPVLAHSGHVTAGGKLMHAGGSACGMSFRDQRVFLTDC